MDISRAYLVGMSRCSFRSGEASKITNAVVVKPKKDSEPRLCFQVEFEDGRVDYIPVEEFYNGTVEIRHTLGEGVTTVLKPEMK